jgi:small-conductance mechanosensitive channel
VRVTTGILGLTMVAATLRLGMAAPQATPVQDANAENAAIIRHLDVAIEWYKQLLSADESAGQPSDAYYLENARTLAKQAVQLAFQSADAEAALLLSEKGGDSDAASYSQTSSEKQNITKSVANYAAQISQIQTQIETLDSQIPKVYGKKLQELISQRDSLQDQLEFDKTLQEALQKLSAFMSESTGKKAGLQMEIEDLKKSVPELFSQAAGKGAPSSGSSPSANTPQATGLFGQAAILFSSLGELRAIKQLIEGASRVIAAAREVQTPIRSKLRTTIAQAHNLSNLQAAQDSETVQANRAKMASLTAQFKQISSAAIPLAQEIILVEESQASLLQWRVSVHKGYTYVLESFLAHLALLLLGIGIVMGISEIWRKATFRYVRDSVRRHQLLLLRRFVTAFLLAVVLLIGFVSEFGSLATFAGFLTAGIAVALQTVILSVAAYFFLLGRHGIRVGDRISVSGVTGDVIDVGLVRLSLMELTGAGSDVHPTGRLMVVSNSVLFSGTLFKQIPGTAYAWHELHIKLQSGGDFAMAEKKMLEAVNSIYSLYRDSLEQQQQALEGLMAVTAAVPSPESSLQLVENGLDLIVRYPVLLHQETEIDNKMAVKVMEIINGDPELKAAVGSPTIRPAAKI